MSHYLIELVIWMLIAYGLGCLVGWLIRNMRGGQQAAAPVAAKPVAPPAPAQVVAKPIAPPAPVMAKPVSPTPVPIVPAAPMPPVVAPVAVSRPAPVPVSPPAPRPVPAPAMAEPVGKMARPKGLSAARGGKPDDLQRISGIGPKNEAILHNLGFYHFDQIAAWTKAEISWVDDHLRFNGRIDREQWVKQSSLLAQGKDDQFAKEFGTGGIKGKDGQTQSGTQTRRR